PPADAAERPPGDTAERPLRADAERNRQRILAAARELFGARGLAVSLDDIAAHAGVGVGTVYRRFATRDALIEALFEQRIEEIAEAGRRELDNDDAWEGFASFLREATQLQATDRGLREALFSHGPGRERVNQARAKIGPVAVQLIRRAQQAGQLRSDLGTFDVPMVQVMVGAVADAARDVAPDIWERFVGIILDGMRQSREGPTPLAAPPLDEEQFVATMARAKGASRSS
ncbi:MAG: TetR/AcrR family transcriptional regulator, partial [Thermoleophilaceae bacterium]